ncbi:hypothetical protein EUGRSUZ_C02210 [Eucalyptus grandis]|uniref:Uncharacterized protein n=2 Tax=Eucalyptus grandis TaxID=71139 RepID=A0ACC3LFA3_EUCGR|nr:hypothetical protein EUGRSUZ_C02210 [Eucalyptus grandis]
MALGTTGCIADGLTMSLIMILLSNLMNGYASTSLGPGDANKYALDLFYVAVAGGSGSFLVLWPEVGFFDQNRGAPMTSQVVSRISVDTLTIQGVLTERIANFITNILMFVGAQLAALYLCWRLPIVAIPALLLLIIPGLASSIAGGIVEQVLLSIRTVYSFVGEKWTTNGYKILLEPVLNLGIKQGLIKGMAIGSIGISYVVWALQGWYGSILVTGKGFKGGNLFAAGVCIIYGGLALGSALINFKYFSEANVAASRIFEMTEHVPRIALVDEEGTMLSNVRGEVEFKDLYFAHPSRPESSVLKKFSLRVMASQTVGFVGRSGPGKSTIINLLERFSDPVKGDIFLDGTNIKTLQLKWLRSQMVLLGQSGIQMSEGQKERISIARALLKDPRILLLDEATSALDSHSEKAVQDALNEASIGRTTFVVAHRLSALSNADLIMVIQSGEVIESGSHDKVMENEHGPYSTMVQLQRTSGKALFDKLLTFEVEWFDQEDNNSGALCSRLATDAAIVRNLVGDRVAFFTQAISAATLAVILGFLLSWRLNHSSELASEAVANHRVITVFDSEQKMLNLYENTRSGPREVSHKRSWFAGGGLFIAQFLTAVRGEVEFKRVDFFYPTRPKHMILKDMNLHIGAEKIVALVGKIDVIDIRRYNLRGLRSHIALVSQEPTIFAATIYENIRYGRENATESEVIAAATLANAHEFISSMEDGYATYCGEEVAQLSGGQRQRLALALETIQEALEKTMTGRTCVVVAHRLSTIQRSDKITVLDKGRIVEEGSHSELFAEGENGLYFSLVKVQQLAAMT